MNMNRRNVIVGLGTVVVGGGAALGSGAFSTAEASRELEVNVVTGVGIAEDFVDIVLRNVDGTNSLDIDGDGATDRFPDSGDTYGNSGFSPADDDVSLMQEEVTLVFGPDGHELPPNSTVGYDDLITIVNDEGDSGQEFEVTFDVTGDTSLEFEPSNPTVGIDETEDVDVDVITDSDPETEEGTLEITIEEA